MKSDLSDNNNNNNNHHHHSYDNPIIMNSRSWTLTVNITWKMSKDSILHLGLHFRTDSHPVRSRALVALDLLDHKL